MGIAIGDTLAERYEVLSVHPGGMGVVYILRDRGTGELHAAKTVKRDLRDDPRVRGRFAREVTTWIRLGRHPNLVEARRFEEIDGRPFLFLEYIDGPTLAEVLRRDGPLLIIEALDIALQAARGLTHAHETPVTAEGGGIVHRDVKPENLFITKEHVVKVTDLGIAKVRTAGLDATAEGIGVGTPFYVSPEQLKGRRDVDGRSDVYSLGAVLYQMLTGRLPLEAESLETQIYQILRVVPERPSLFNPWIPPALDEIVLACLEKNPADRFSGLRPFSERIRALLADPEVLGGECAESGCERCGYPSLNTPEECPVCSGPMGPPVPCRSRALDTEPAVAPRRADVHVVGIEAVPRTVRVGENLEVTIRLVNRGAESARQVTMEWPVPDRDVFRLVAPEQSFVGEVPPTPPGRSFAVKYVLVPLREGDFSLPEVEVRYLTSDGEKTCRLAEPVRFHVTFNYTLPLVGREDALARMKRFVESDGPGFALVEGDAGSGRSRILREAAERLEGLGYSVYRGKALERVQEPLKLFQDVARDIFEIGLQVLTPASLMARVIDRLGPLVEEDRALAGFFVSFIRGADMTESQVKMRGYLWHRLLASMAASRPVALVLDDLQWAERESLDLAETLVRRAAEVGLPLKIVAGTLAAGPGEETRRRIAHLKDRFFAMATTLGLTERIVLPRLGAAEVGQLLDLVFPGNTLTEDHPWLLPALTSLSGGNPFHVVQILKQLREARDDRGEPLVSAEEGAWTLKGGLTEERIHQWIPQAVGDMVRALLAPLAEPLRETLEAAAIIGEEFEVRLLDNLVKNPGDLDAHLETLEQADLVRMSDDAGEKFQFTSSQVPVIIEDLLKERSRRAYIRLHQAVAGALESSLSPRELKRFAHRYARHLLLAGEKRKALRWFVTAARQMVKQQLFLRADTLLRSAERLLEEGVAAPRAIRGRCFFLRGEVCRVTGQLQEALSAYDAAIDSQGGPGGRSDHARTLSRMGMVHEIRGEIDRAMYCYQLGAQIREDMGEPAEMASSLNDLGSVLLVTGEEERARLAFERARELAEEAGNDSALATALDKLATVAAARDHWEEADRLHRESLAISEATGDRLGAARSLNGLGTLALRAGDLSGARQWFEQSIELRREVGDRAGTASVLSNLGVIHDRLGDYEGALRNYRRSAEVHRSVGSRIGLATVLNNIGVVNLVRGDVGMAAQRFEEALAIRREMGDRSRLPRALANLGEAALMGGRISEARKHFDEALEVCRALADDMGIGSIHAERVALARAEGDLAGAERELELGMDKAGREPRVRGQLHIEAAELLCLRGDFPGARRAAERALELAAEAGDQISKAQALRLIGQALEGVGEPEEALRRLAEAEVVLGRTSGPELARVLLARARVLKATDSGRSREVLMRVRGLLDAMESRGAILPERDEVERLLEG